MCVPFSFNCSVSMHQPRSCAEISNNFHIQTSRVSCTGLPQGIKLLQCQHFNKPLPKLWRKHEKRFSIRIIPKFEPPWQQRPSGQPGLFVQSSVNTGLSQGVNPVALPTAAESCLQATPKALLETTFLLLPPPSLSLRQ